jgi:hypothetical protein
MGTNLDTYLAVWQDEQWTPIDGVGGPVNNLAVATIDTGPELVIAGDFTSGTGQAHAGIARWNGQRLAGIGAGLGGLCKGQVLRVFDDGHHGPRLWVGATGGNNLALWDGQAWQNPVPSISGLASVSSLAEVNKPDGTRSLFIGGSFTTVNGTLGSSNIAELVVCRRMCNADFNFDGDVGTDADINDFFACLGGNCCATCGSIDFNSDGDDGTDADIEAFFRVLAGGSC